MKSVYWTRQTHLFRNDEYICSKCKHTSAKALRYCPCCGSRMKGIKYSASWVDEMEALDAIFED